MTPPNSMSSGAQSRKASGYLKGTWESSRLVVVRRSAPPAKYSVQQYVEINATGFRKILKKFDKRSTSATKELYLARRVDIQPVFNRQVCTRL